MVNAMSTSIQPAKKKKAGNAKSLDPRSSLRRRKGKPLSGVDDGIIALLHFSSRPTIVIQTFFLSSLLNYGQYVKSEWISSKVCKDIHS